MNESRSLWESEQIPKIRGHPKCLHLLCNLNFPLRTGFLQQTIFRYPPPPSLLFFWFCWMFSKCHGKCQWSLNRQPTDIRPCLVSPPPVCPDFGRGAEGPSPVLVTSFFFSCIFTRIQGSAIRTSLPLRISCLFSPLPPGELRQDPALYSHDS